MTFTIPFEAYGDGEVIHFAHANGYPPGAYRQFLEALGRDYRVLAIQHRPMWSTMDPADMHDWRLVTGDLIDFLDAHDLRDVVGVGHSLGGVATMYAAIQRPDLFRALVFVEPVFLPAELLATLRANPQISLFGNSLVQRALRRRNYWPDRQAAFDHYRPKSVFNKLPDAALWDYINYGLKEDGDGVTLAYPREWEARFYELAPTDVWECVPQLTQPTLAIRAAESDTIFPEPWALWQTLQPQATFIEIPYVGHLLTMEQPECVAEHIRRFINDLDQQEDV
jgi:pimeloyl-ACP methyl ester carboxylesterase